MKTNSKLKKILSYKANQDNLRIKAINSGRLLRLIARIFIGVFIIFTVIAFAFIVEEKNLHIECPSYARRIVIFNDIFTNTTTRGLSASLILFCDNEGVELTNIFTFTDILGAPETEEEKELELVLAELFYLKIENPDEDYTESAEENNVGQGYRLLRDPFV